LLIGHLDQAEHALAELDPTPFPPAACAAYELVVAGIAMRRLRAQAARDALERAARAALRANISALTAEIENAAHELHAPAARTIVHGEERQLRLDEVETLLASPALVIDACRHAVRAADTIVPLAKRPVLFALARALGEAWPREVPRNVLIADAFRTKHADETHRARLRVEIGRLRRMLRPLADIEATPQGFILVPRDGREVATMMRLVDEKHAAVLALLADGESWSSSALAMALGTSQRTVQRALDALAATDKIQAVGSGRARRWMMPPVRGFATILLLPAHLPGNLG